MGFWTRVLVSEWIITGERTAKQKTSVACASTSSVRQYYTAGYTTQDSWSLNEATQFFKWTLRTALCEQEERKRFLQMMVLQLSL